MFGCHCNVVTHAVSQKMKMLKIEKGFNCITFSLFVCNLLPTEGNFLGVDWVMFSLRNMIFMALMIHNVPLKYYKRVRGRQKQMNFLFIKNLSFFLIRQTITKENSFIRLYFILLDEKSTKVTHKNHFLYTLNWYISM